MFANDYAEAAAGVSGAIDAVHSALRRVDLEERPQSPVGVTDRFVNRSLLTSLGIGNGSRLDYGQLYDRSSLQGSLL
ncbi:hypothetical protein MLD38_037021 [Melastoma candidum]|uniref:Uncharacterized protein n=2 Tax=Melastoma candidum TaxID=119954 RepID=A0ACB9LLE8_9MYRT|nr:hypothetical protein MLD38_037018 [Melastoma candidum]KAI4312180.1 hypothetical protein MLD38_037021 [Melastoma candidum]